MLQPGSPREKIGIRGLDPQLWREVRGEAVRLGITAGELLNRIIRRWVEGGKEGELR